MNNETKEQKARELFGAGKSVNAVAKELGIAWADAKKLKPTDPDAKQDEDEAKDIWPINLQVPVDQIDFLLERIPEQELLAAIKKMEPGSKAGLFEIVMQSRLDDLLNPMLVLRDARTVLTQRYDDSTTGQLAANFTRE